MSIEEVAGLLLTCFIGMALIVLGAIVVAVL